MRNAIRLGVDLGGTKIAITALNEAGEECFATRAPSPRGDYRATLEAIAAIVDQAETALHRKGETRIGLSMPGSISPHTGRVQNANSHWLNGQRLDHDLAERLGRPLRLSNDANCFALSESRDGAAKDARSVFGVILGTGCGGGFVVNGRLLEGPRGATGEWGHNPLPWPQPDEVPGPQCWCGLSGCLESWISGPGLHKDFLKGGGDPASASSALDVTQLASRGDRLASAAMDRHASRLARGLATIVNIFDPEAIVLGGGLSQVESLYRQVPDLIQRYVFADMREITLLPPIHGDASGARGAARLWDNG